MVRGRQGSAFLGCEAYKRDVTGLSSRHSAHSSQFFASLFAFLTFLTFFFVAAMLLSSLVQFALISAALLAPVTEAKKHKPTTTTKQPKPTKTPKPCKGKKCTTTPPSGGGNTTTPTPGNGLNPTYLFPVAFQSAFSTAPPSPALPQDNDVKRVPLSDKDLDVEKNTSGVTHDVVDADGAPSGTRAWEAVYPKGALTLRHMRVLLAEARPVLAGSYNPSGTPRGGFGFYFGGPAGFDFTKANELLFSYAVKFEAGFDWKYALPLSDLCR